jgi:hypothetical protein
MSGWQELKAERNRRSLVRLTRALPLVFPRAVLTRALARPFVPPTPRLAIESYWGAHPIRADRLARALAARSQAPDGWRWRLGDRKSDLPFTFRTPPHRSVNMRTHSGLDFAACAVNRFIASAGTLTFGVPVPTRTQSGTVLASSRGSSGMRQAATYDFCGASKFGAALKAVDGCGGPPKLIIASHCSGSGANTGTRLGRDCWIFGDCPTFRLLTATFTLRNAPQKRGTVPRALFRDHKPLIDRKLEPFKTIEAKWREPNAAKRQLALLPSALP